MRRLLLAAAVFAVATFASGCAVTDEQTPPGAAAYQRHAEDPARIGLPQPYRVFYDELKDEGDWTLIEPYGYVFRPRVNFVAWRPYQDGWWEPSDYYGWIWNTYEPFGWITYHYGSWFYDEYQGWVWQPGSVWGPAWVAWVDTGDYVGWGPLAPTAYNEYDKVPDGVFTFAPVQQFAARNVGEHATYVSSLPQGMKTFDPIVNVGHANGVTFNKGPDANILRQRGVAVGEPIDAASIPRVKLVAPLSRSNEADLQARTARLVTAGRTQLRRLVDTGVAPPSSGGGQRVGTWAPRTKPAAPAAKAARSDTSHVKHPAHPRAPADSTAHQPKPKKAPSSVPEAAPDTTHAR